MSPDSKVHRAIMGPIWGRQDPGGSQVGPMNFAICVVRKMAAILSRIARPPHQPPVILSSTPELGLTPLTCVCWQINSILANIGHRNSIRILNQYPFWWNILIWA